MSTTSTKSRGKKKPDLAVEETNGDGWSPIRWRIASASILIAGAFLRLYDLALVPLHHDEGVNGNFLVTLVREGKYTYDPQNYHGPTLYFISAVIPWIVRFFGGKTAGDVYGLTTFNIRLVTAAFGVATIWLALLLRKRLGAIGALSAAGLIAISPGAVYLSRYFIHESLYVFFGLGIVIAALKYYDSRNSVYLILATISAALMTATKETWIINGPVLLIALVTTSVIFWLREKFARGAKRKADVSLGERAQQIVDRLGGPVSLTTVALVCLAVFIIINVLFYSSFFTNYPKGVNDALLTLSLWRKRTVEHAHPWWQYAYWLIQEEGIVLILAGVGAGIAVWRANNRLAVFLSLWSFGLLAAYSIAGMSISRLLSDLFVHHTITQQTYKTPWICLNFIVPLALTGGYALEAAYQKIRELDQPGVFIALASLCVVISGYQMISLNFIHYDDDSYPYVYAHTKREMLKMLGEVDRIGKRLRTGEDTGIAIVSPDYWPLPWYFRNYKRVGYYQQIVPTNEPLIIGSMAEAEQLKSTFGDRYQLVSSGSNEDGSYPLRPGVDLLLYVRRDVAR